MKIVVKDTLLLPGDGWNTNTNQIYTKYDIYFNMRTGIIHVIETKQDNKFGHTIRNCHTYESPAKFIYKFCEPRNMDIRDYTDITELEPGVECLLYCYLFILYERMIDLTIDNKGDHDRGDV